MWFGRISVTKVRLEKGEKNFGKIKMKTEEMIFYGAIVLVLLYLFSGMGQQTEQQKPMSQQEFYEMAKQNIIGPLNNCFCHR